VPLLICIIDPKNELAAVVPRPEPVEQCGPNPADVQIAGGARGETSAYAHEIQTKATTRRDGAKLG
jgi:hypothetical protein